jgi:hypothetical protein
MIDMVRLYPGNTTAAVAAGTPKTLYHISPRRIARGEPSSAWDRGELISMSSVPLTGDPVWWDFTLVHPAKVIRTYPAPSALCTLLVRYWRHTNPPATTATGAALDIPDQFVDYVIAMASWKLLLTRGDRGDRAAQFRDYWIAGMENAKRMHEVTPDDDMAFVPSSEDLRPNWDMDHPNDYMYGY